MKNKKRQRVFYSRRIDPACFTCKRLKSRCDGEYPTGTCSQCKRLGVQCKYPSEEERILRWGKWRKCDKIRDVTYYERLMKAQFHRRQLLLKQEQQRRLWIQFHRQLFKQEQRRLWMEIQNAKDVERKKSELPVNEKHFKIDFSTLINDILL